MPLPPGAIPGILMDGEYEVTSGDILAVGSFVGGGGFRKAALWERDAAGTWSVPTILPDNGPGTNAEALAMMIVPDGGALAGQVIVAGGVEVVAGSHMPAMWVETGLGTGTFDLHLPPMPGGVFAGHFTGTAVDDLGLGGDFTAGRTASAGTPRVFLQTGTVELFDETTRGLIVRSTDFASWDIVVLPPLPYFANAEVVGFGGTTTGDLGSGGQVAIVSGTSYNVDPLTDGRATHWRLYNAPESLVYDRIVDVNTLAIGLPAGARMVTHFGGQTMGDLGGSIFTAGTIVLDANAAGGGNTAAGAPIPHAYGFEELPAGGSTIPAASTWDLVVMALLVFCAGAMILTRARQSAANV